MPLIRFDSARRNGPRIVALGGGTGLSNMLRGLKKYTENITAIVTVSDDGGHSGILRRDLGILPPGDIRNCLLALSNIEPIMESLIDYRFGEGELRGQNVGNLIIAALSDICGSFSVAVSQLSQVLAITGRVLPVTTQSVYLQAEFENGDTVLGESKIAEYKKELGSRIAQVSLKPGTPGATPEVLSAISQADMIVFGPGSLYTSIVPNLLVRGVSEAIRESNALRVFVCNVMTQEGETEGYSVSDHLRALERHGAKCDVCLANSEPVSQAAAERYALEGAGCTKVDAEAVRALGVRLLTRPVMTEAGGYVRHDPWKLAQELIMLHYREHDRGELRRFDEAMAEYLAD
ncbi:MAG: gluconeogenesis factor YvcK family protein [Oscillospiraceae bacterium]|jgi:uncharacterized cofD-like protein